MYKNNKTVEIADRLKEVRVHKKISQEKMAFLMNLTHSTYVKIENAYQNLTVKNLINACEILDVSSDLILFGKIHKSDEQAFNFDDFLKFSQIFDVKELKSTEDKIKQILKLKNTK